MGRQTGNVYTQLSCSEEEPSISVCGAQEFDTKQKRHSSSVSKKEGKEKNE